MEIMISDDINDNDHDDDDDYMFLNNDNGRNNYIDDIMIDV